MNSTVICNHKENYLKWEQLLFALQVSIHNNFIEWCFVKKAIIIAAFDTDNFKMPLFVNVYFCESFALSKFNQSYC